jgi:hypothetical protein
MYHVSGELPEARKSSENFHKRRNHQEPCLVVSRRGKLLLARLKLVK